MRRLRSLIAGLALAAVLPGFASAQNVAPETTAPSPILTEADPQIVLTLARAHGLASLDADSSGDPMIVGRLHGVKYLVYFYGCTDRQHCRSIQFASGHTDALSAERANDWNAKLRFGRLYAADGSNLRMDCDFQGGVTRDWLDAQFSTWSAMIAQFEDFTK